MAEVVKELAPDLPCCTSFDVLPEIKEYERTSTTVVNTYVLPIVERYLTTLREGLDARGVGAPLLIMQSNGGLTPAAEAAARPVNIVESGPAAGVVGARAIARQSGLRERRQLRHGRDHRQGVARRARRVHPHPRVLGGRRHHDRLAAAHRRRLPAERPGHRSRGGRGGRRLDRPHRHRRFDAGRAAERRGQAGSGVLRPRRRGADGHRRERGAGSPEPVVPVRGRAPHRRRGKPPRDGGRGGAPARACVGSRGVGRAAGGDREHDPGHPRCLVRARARPARLRAVRLRRQRSTVRDRDGGGDGDADHRRPARGGPFLRLRAALRGDRAPLLAHRAAGAPRRRPGRNRRDLPRARGTGRRAARGGRIRRRTPGVHPRRDAALPGADLRAGSAGAGNADRPRGAGRPRGILRARARAHLRTPGRSRGAGGAGDRTGAGPGPR